MGSVVGQTWLTLVCAEGTSVCLLRRRANCAVLHDREVNLVARKFHGNREWQLCVHCRNAPSVMLKRLVFRPIRDVFRLPHRRSGAGVTIRPAVPKGPTPRLATLKEHDTFQFACRCVENLVGLFDDIDQRFTTRVTLWQTIVLFRGQKMLLSVVFAPFLDQQQRTVEHVLGKWKVCAFDLSNY